LAQSCSYWSYSLLVLQVKEFEKHEKYVQDLLDLDSTIASGNQSRDPGDGVSRAHYSDQDYRLYAEAKCTEQKSYSIKRDDIAAYAQRAAEYGKTFCLPVRFIQRNCYTDYIVLRLLDFSDILSCAQRPTRTHEAESYLAWIVDKITNDKIREEARIHLKNLVESSDSPRN
jgi:hypothetical protein